ncbi:hypothetical protein Glove_150g68 [Diversispora epigaea]|uniref:BTB domain-containing protein n=1 Tax=Diversispora epigaea TaxID=1348612 RepID=A0A397J2C3_9GLOM|nr:hypothetical protein Glove_150g68 [Diversispora epigaea]
MTTKFFDRLSNDLTQLLEDPIDYNVSIEVGKAPNNQIFKTHSYILQSRSPYFKKKFNETPFNDNHVKLLKLPNISVKIFNVIIKYIYGGIISLEKLENSFIFDLLIYSEELELDELVKHLQPFLVNNNSSWLRLNFARIYQTSYQIKNLEIIQDFCNGIIAKHPNTIFESEKFLSLPEDTLISIIKRDDLQLEEGKIWEYVVQWGKAKNPTLPANLDGWTSDNFLTLKKTLKKCFPHIRYFNFSNEDVLEKLFPYQQILEPKLWLDINTKIMAPNKPISSKALPPRKILTKTLPTRNTLSPLSSHIITDEHALEISSWIDKKEIPYTENNPYKFELLVKGSRDGFDIKTIYNICDKISNTVIVLKVEGTGEILGGYNPLEWEKTSQWKTTQDIFPFPLKTAKTSQWKTTQDCFAFSLKTANLKNSILSRVKIFNYAMYYDQEIFQFGHTLVLKDNIKADKSCFCMRNSDYTYKKPIRSDEFLSKAYFLPNITFSVEEYEVFKVSQ